MKKETLDNFGIAVVDDNGKGARPHLHSDHCGRMFLWKVKTLDFQGGGVVESYCLASDEQGAIDQCSRGSGSFPTPEEQKAINQCSKAELVKDLKVRGWGKDNFNCQSLKY